ncbi:hypothetical protein U746_0143 [Mycolicibacterium mucogenicum 261Sha1.1M5]|uniref:DUF7455 domain-containing protein n=1 Tax=Leucobacter aridicollis TaxID=283878 RepID=UPI000EAE36F7|nr:hypothetical protein [Leucobacter aridicollis]MCS3428315.1 hypothetical protein [Leucobacter aridicollis]RKQ94401.1 hypothetical protein U746_0143 [Mycolicibacterium mucogenicum 261Sha1.1M5]
MSTLEQTANVAEVTAADRPLSGLDRCDSCGAQAYVRVTLGGSELLFCAHHATKHEAKLRPMAEAWHDESHKLSA